jgi:uncharacterized membrane protein YphA (DoxX/SURF4 family)
MHNVDLMAHLPLLFTTLFVAILFIQSGLDKVFNFKANLEFLTGHFSKTVLAPTVPIMLVTITLMETVTGVLAAIGLVYFLATGVMSLIFYASVLGAASLTALFFGQRIAQDYPGAAVLVPYFILVIILMYLSRVVS